MPNIFKFKGFQCEIPAKVIAAASVVALILGTAWIYLHYIHEDVVRVIIEMEDQSAGMQAQESMKHIVETPAHVQELLNGRIKIKHYESDNCVLVEWHEEGSYPIPTFVIHPERTFKKIENEKITMLFSTPAYAGGLKARCEEADCVDAERCYELFPEGHPGRFEQYVEKPIGECGLAIIWRRYEDCCVTKQEYSPCDDIAGPIEFTCCRH